MFDVRYAAIDTSLASGRDMLAGISRFNKEMAEWSLFHQPRGLEEHAFDALLGWEGDGILIRLQHRDWLEPLIRTKIPAIDLLGLHPHPKLPRVLPNDAAISKLAFEHFTERGFRNFAYFGIDGESWSIRRLESLREQLSKSGRDLHSLIVPRFSKKNWDQQQESVGQWLEQLPKPVAILVCSDQRGPEIVEACRRLELRVPDEVAILGVDNDETLCSISQPSLSSICPNHCQVGFQAASILDSWLQGNTPAPETLVEPRTVIVRRSSDAYAVGDEDISKALIFIHEHCRDPISVDDIVAITTASRSVLQRKFRKHLQRTIHDVVLDERLKLAKSLLSETKLPLVRVAERSGFVHQEYLGYVCKRKLGMTPASYRKAYTQLQD
jgi:LacI family transcriptional regulator